MFGIHGVTAPATPTEIALAVEQLRHGSLWVQPQTMPGGWSRETLGEDDWSYTQAFEYTDDAGIERKLICQDDSVVYLDNDGALYQRHEYDSYADLNSSDDGELDATAVNDETAWEALFDVDPSMYGAEGPMMNSWYPCHAADDREAASKLADLPLCVVKVDKEYGLALTGGGMDLTWEIARAYINLGQLPPVRYARDLPAMAGYGKSPAHRLVIAACLRSLSEGAKILSHDADRLGNMAAQWQASL